MTAPQLAYLAVVGIATLGFVVSGGVLGRVAIGAAELREATGSSGRGLPQIVVIAPVMVIGMMAILWLSSVNALAGALAIAAVFLSIPVLNRRQPHADELRASRSRLSATMRHHPAAAWGLRALFIGYLATLVLATLIIRPAG